MTQSRKFRGLRDRKPRAVALPARSASHGPYLEHSRRTDDQTKPSRLPQSQFGDWITCRLIDDNDLVAIAAGSQQIKTRQPHGSGWVPNTLINHLVQPLRALCWIDDPTTPEPSRLRREMRRPIADARARIRIRCGRNVLAGVTHRMVEGKHQQILVLVLAGQAVRSCDWQLA
jgi:hypothetical protein